MGEDRADDLAELAKLAPTLPRMSAFAVTRAGAEHSAQTAGAQTAGAQTAGALTPGASPGGMLRANSAPVTLDPPKAAAQMGAAPHPRETPEEQREQQSSARSRRLALTLGGALAVAPLLLISFILLMIWTRTPHVPFWDEWGTVTLVQHFTQGTLTWNDFWAFHDQHRIVVPQMLDLGLILATHWNRQIEMTFDLLLSVAEWGLLLDATHGLRSKTLTVLAAAPFALAIFSLSQYQNWLWSFQITFICTVFGVALCLWALSIRRAPGWAFALALVGAVVAALSSLGGLVVFVAFSPAVLSLGYKKTLLWVAVAVGVIVPYMQGFPHDAPLALSLDTLKFCTTYLGGPVGYPTIIPAFAAGAASLLLAVVNVLYYWARERRIAPLLPWVGLGAFAIGVGGVIGVGRLTPGSPWEGALASRYLIFAALWWVALIYVSLLNGKAAWMTLRRDTTDAGMVASPRLRQATQWIVRANGLALVASALGLLLVSVANISNMETYQYGQLQTEACVVNADNASLQCLWQFYPAPPEMQQKVVYLRAQRYGIFSGDYQSLVQPEPAPPMHPLVRLYDPANDDHWSTTDYNLNYYGSYVAEQALGDVYDQAEPGTHALYTCLTADGRHVSSLSQACVGETYLRTEGWLLDKPIHPSQDVALYACASPGGNFLSPQANCEGQTNEGLLGYALALPTKLTT